MLRIFQAQSAEHYAVARTLFVEYAEQLGHDLCFQRFDQELESLPGAYAPPTGRLLLATRSDEWIGCVGLRGFEASATICEMKRLYVRPSFRRQGIGRRLAEEVIRAARTIGYQRMRLDTLRAMEPARALYRLLGFCEIAPYYHNPIDDVVFYELDLAQTPR